MEPTGADPSSADRFQPPTGGSREGEQGRRATRPHFARPFFAGGRPTSPPPRPVPPEPRPASPEPHAAEPAFAHAPPPPSSEPPAHEADQPAVVPAAGADVEFPWEAPVPELLLTDVVEVRAVAEEVAPSWMSSSEATEAETAAMAPERSGGVESMDVDEPADDFMAGAGIGDYEREQDSGYDVYGTSDAAAVEDEIAEPASLPEDAYFIQEPLEAATAPDTQATGEDARELAGELQMLADALRRDGLAALGRAVRGEPRLQALVAAVLSAYTASPSDGD